MKSAMSDGRVPRFVTLLTVLVCLWGIGFAGQTALARHLSDFGLMTDDLASVASAVSINPDDPELHYALGLILSTRGDTERSRESFEQAVRLRPRDYFLWLELARARDLLSDSGGAALAFRESIRLAPFYAQPRWQLGNFLLRERRRDEAFAELRHAAARDRALWRPVIELAWGTFNGDVAAIKAALQPQTSVACMTLARFLIRHNKPAEGLELYKAARSESPKDRHNIITDLLANCFAEAIELLRTPGVSARTTTTVVTKLIEAKRVDEAAALATEIQLPEHDRQAVLALLLENQRYGQAANLLKAFKEPSDQQRRLVLRGLIASRELKEAISLVNSLASSERERQEVFKALMSSSMFAEAIELLRTTSGNNEQQWHALFTEIVALKDYGLAIEMMRASGGVPERDRRELYRRLFAERRYEESYALWQINRTDEMNDRSTGIVDGGFENKIFAAEPGFGWQTPRRLTEVNVSLDAAERRDGAQSLRLEWLGDTKPAIHVVSQLTSTKPQTRYRLNFSLRTSELVSAGLPVVTITDARRDGGPRLAQSEVPAGTTGWRDYAVQFVTPPETTAVIIAVQRQKCSVTSAVCPIFGTLWLDRFSLRAE